MTQDMSIDARMDRIYRDMKDQFRTVAITHLIGIGIGDGHTAHCSVTIKDPINVHIPKGACRIEYTRDMCITGIGKTLEDALTDAEAKVLPYLQR